MDLITPMDGPSFSMADMIAMGNGGDRVQPEPRKRNRKAPQSQPGKAAPTHTARTLNAYMRSVGLEQIQADTPLPNGQSVGEYLLEAWKTKEQSRLKNKS